MTGTIQTIAKDLSMSTFASVLSPLLGRKQTKARLQG
jgi:hypothetical protein